MAVVSRWKGEEARGDRSSRSSDTASWGGIISPGPVSPSAASLVEPCGEGANCDETNRLR